MSRLHRRFAATTVTLGTEGGPANTDTRAATVAAEEPLEIRAAGRTLATTMRTPGHDIELAHGYLLTQGLIQRAGDVVTARYCAGGASGENTYNLLDIQLAGPLPVVDPPIPATSACGVPAAQIASEVALQLPPVTPAPLDPRAALDLAAALPQGLPAAGTLEVVREDIDIYNAVDKVLGHFILNDAPPPPLLTLNTRATFEVVRKAAMAGIPAVVTTADVTSMAVELARAAGVALATASATAGRVTVFAGELA